MPDSPSSVALVNKNGVTSVPVATEMTTTNLLMKQVKKKNCFNRYNSY
jgi:methylglyoxal synthase